MNAAGVGPPVAPLAHAGAGASWQSLLTTMSLGVVVVFALAVVGTIDLEEADDLVLPLAVVAILSAVGPSLSGVLSDQVGWAVPVGAVALAGLAAATFTDLQLAARSATTWAIVVAAVTAGVVLQGPLTAAWHPPRGTGPAVDEQATQQAATHPSPLPGVLPTAAAT